MAQKLWRNEDVMQKLYEECNTQKEIADKLNTTEYTISNWIRRHGITSHTPKNGVYYRENKSDGHFQINVRDEAVLPEHALTALAAGADPYEVFDDSTHCHHLNKITYDNRPQNIKVVDKEKHQKIHQNEEWARAEGLLAKNTGSQQ